MRMIKGYGMPSPSGIDGKYGGYGSYDGCYNGDCMSGFGASPVIVPYWGMNGYDGDEVIVPRDGVQPPSVPGLEIPVGQQGLSPIMGAALAYVAARNFFNVTLPMAAITAAAGYLAAQGNKIPVPPGLKQSMGAFGMGTRVTGNEDGGGGGSKGGNEDRITEGRIRQGKQQIAANIATAQRWLVGQQEIAKTDTTSLEQQLADVQAQIDKLERKARTLRTEAQLDAVAAQLAPLYAQRDALLAQLKKVASARQNVASRTPVRVTGGTPVTGIGRSDTASSNVPSGGSGITPLGRGGTASTGIKFVSVVRDDPSAQSNTGSATTTTPGTTSTTGTTTTTGGGGGGGGGGTTDTTDTGGGAADTGGGGAATDTPPDDTQQKPAGGMGAALAAAAFLAFQLFGRK